MILVARAPPLNSPFRSHLHLIATNSSQTELTKMSNPLQKTEILHAYRALLRAGLRAVKFSAPSHYVIRDQLRKAFRDPRATYETHFDKYRILRTVHFLHAAAYESGVESRVLKNLCRVEWERRHSPDGRWSWKRVLAARREGEEKARKGGGRRDLKGR